MYGLQELKKAEEPHDESRMSAKNGKPPKIGRVFKQSKSEEVTKILIQVTGSLWSCGNFKIKFKISCILTEVGEDFNIQW